MDGRGSVKQRQGAFDNPAGLTRVPFRLAKGIERTMLVVAGQQVSTTWNGSSKPLCLQKMPVEVRCLCKQAFGVATVAQRRCTRLTDGLYAADEGLQKG